MYYPTCTHQVEFTSRQGSDSDVVFPCLEVGFANFLQKSRIDVGAQNIQWCRMLLLANETTPCKSIFMFAADSLSLEELVFAYT